MSSFTEYSTAGAVSRMPLPMSAARDPTASDVLAPGGEPYIVGRVWVNKTSGAIFINAGSGVWDNVAGGSESMASLTVNPGPTSLTGPLTVASNAAGDTITMGSAAQTGVITLGQSTAGETVNINNASGAGNTVNIANGISGNTVALANGANTSAQTVNIANGASGANSTVNILSGVGTAGAGSLLMADNTRVTTIDLGNIAPAAARTTTIAGGNQAQNDSVLILDGAPSANTQTFEVLSGTATGGTQNLNLGNGIGGALTVNMANGINSTAQTVNIANGASAANSTVHILSGVGTAGAGTLQMANNTRVATIDLGNIAPAAARTTTIAGGNSAQNDTVNILAGNPSAGTQTVSILNGTSTGGTQNVNIGNANQAANAVSINSGATNGTSIFAGTTTNIVATQTGTTVQGMANNVAPAAGKIGEQIRSAIAFASAVTSTTTTVTNVTSISLTAGIWDVSGVVIYTGMTTATFQQASVGTTSATIGTVGDNAVQGVWTSTTPGDFGLTIPAWRLALNSTTTVYLVGQGTYSAGTGKLYGRISATRVA